MIQWADQRGDSFKLAQFAADNDQATDIVFCGVHFMAESADVLTADHQRVILPDLNAGCSMADMADIDQVEEAWAEIATVTAIDRVVPVTYMNSAAAFKAFVGQHGGAVCTSSNARAVLAWALERGDKVLFFPDQHLGRNTGFDMGYTADDMRVWNPRLDCGGLEDREVKDSTLLLWKGHCSVHQRFTNRHTLTPPAPSTPPCRCWCTRSARTKWWKSPIGLARPSASRTGSPKRRPVPSSRSRPRSTWCSAGTRAPRQDGVLARPAHLPVRHDVPHRRAAPRVDARGARRRPRREPDRRRRRRRRMGKGRPPTNARHHLKPKNEPALTGGSVVGPWSTPVRAVSRTLVAQCAWTRESKLADSPRPARRIHA